ncbi:MAG: ComF family protein [Desulfovibrionaceae bacterium]
MESDVEPGAESGADSGADRSMDGIRGLLRRARGLATRVGLAAGLAGGRCPGCGRTVAETGHAPSGPDAAPSGPAPDAPAARPHGLCPACAAALAPRPGGFCPSCGAVVGLPGHAPEPCGECLTEPPPWTGFACHGAYRGLLRELILGFKFAEGLGRVRLLQDLAWAALLRAGLPAPDLLAPVPLHPRRLRWRGYNQSLELARGLALRLDRPAEPRALVRLRHTVPQSRLSAAERLVNLKGAFEADEGLVRGRAVLLVDDVSTTGSTLRECAEALNAAGAARVDVLVLARA